MFKKGSTREFTFYKFRKFKTHIKLESGKFIKRRNLSHQVEAILHNWSLESFLIVVDWQTAKLIQRRMFICWRKKIIFCSGLCSILSNFSKKGIQFIPSFFFAKKWFSSDCLNFKLWIWCVEFKHCKLFLCKARPQQLHTW